MTAGSGTQRAGCVALPPPPLRCLKGSTTRLCQSMRDGGTALLTVMDPGRGLETCVHLQGSGALPLLARSHPPEPPGPKNCLLQPQHPTQCACSQAQGSGGRPHLLGGPRKHTHTRVEMRCKARGRPLVHLTTGAAAAPTAGCMHAADTRVWQEGEALDAVSLPDRSGHALRVCLATRPRGKIRLSRPRQTDV